MMTYSDGSIYYTAAETAKFVRAELKKSFPGVKFSVRSTANRVQVDWQDGPAWDAVNAVVKQFAGATFDSMTDLKEYHSSTDGQGRKVRYGADWTNCDRHISRELMERVAAQEAANWGIEDYTVEVYMGGKYECAHVVADWNVKVGIEQFTHYVHSIARKTAA